MLPLMLDVAAWPVLVAGRGPALTKRLELLQSSGAVNVSVFSPDPAIATTWTIHRRLPEPAEIAAARLLFGAGLEEAEERRIGDAAREHRVLLNIEDRLPWCDAHVPALVRRGDLLLTVSTGGRSPGVATVLRGWLERLFPPHWAGHLAEAAALRDQLRASGAGMAEVLAQTRRLPFLEKPPFSVAEPLPPKQAAR